MGERLKLTFERKIVAGFALGLFLLLIIGAVSWRSASRFLGAFERVDHTHRVLACFEDVVVSLLEVEASACSYVITGDEALLMPFESGVIGAQRAFAKLEILTADNPSRREPLRRLGSLIEREIAIVRQSVHQRRDSGFAAAAEIIAQREGRVALEEIRKLVHELEADELSLLKARTDRVTNAARTTITVVVLSSSIAIVCVFIAAFRVHQEFRKRQVSEEALQRSLEEIRDLYNNAPCIYHSLDSNGCFVSMNDTGLKLLGYERHELMGKSFSALLRPESLALFREKFPKFKERGSVRDLEFELIRKNGETIHVLLNSTAIKDSTGKYISSRSTMVDISERKRSEAMQHAARIYAESIIDTVREPLVVIDGDYRVVSVNRAFGQMFSVSMEDTCKCTLFSMEGHDWNEPTLRQRLEEVFKTGSPLDDYEMVFDLPQSGKRTLLVDARKIYRPGNHTGMILLALEDITERNRAEAKLRALVGRLESAVRAHNRIMDRSLDIICTIDREGRFVQVSAACQAIWGYAPEELSGRKYMDLVHPDYHELTREAAASIMAGNPVSDFKNHYLRKDGSAVPINWSASWSEEDGTMFCVARDFTEREQAEAKIRALNEDLRLRAAQLEVANKELEAFSYSVSHDLRAPLRHILGFADLLKKDSGDRLTGAGDRYLNTIAASAKRLGVLIDDLLVFSRMGRAEMRWQTVQIDELVQDLLREMQPEMQNRNIVWKCGPLPEVRGDRAMIRQVMENLIDNALKYSRDRDPAEIEIGCSNGEADEVVFFVRDNGVGFDMKYVNKLFGVFQRLHRADQFEGTGIGLANVRRIVQRHGGRTWAEGRLEDGATIYFSLPKRMHA